MNKIKYINNKKGVAIFMVLFIMMFLGILLVAFFSSSQNAQRTAHRFYTSEMARQLAAAAQEEAFIYLYNQTDNPEAKNGSEVSKLFENIVKKSFEIDYGSPMDIKKGVPCNIPITQAIDDRLDVEAKVGIVDFRPHDYWGNKFYQDESGNEYEGIGTLEIVVTVKAKDKYKNVFPGSCVMVRQHDYKVSLIHTKCTDENKKSYTGSYVLDYVLFLKLGQNGFNHYLAKNINPEKRTLKINAATNNGKLGKINLGSGDKEHQYLNLSEEPLDLINFDNGNKYDTEQKIIELPDNKVDEFFPSFKEQVLKDASAVRGHKAVFYHYRLPLMDKYYTTTELQAFRAIATRIAAEVEGRKVSYYKSGLIINPMDRISEILKSDVRKQFFNYGYFKLDLTECVIDAEGESVKLIEHNETKQKVNEFLEKKVPCWDYETYSKIEPNCEEDVKYSKLKPMLEGHPEAFTKLNDDYAYGKGSNPPIDSEKSFFYFSTNSNAEPVKSVYPLNSKYPYAHHNLWNRRYMTKAQFDNLNIYDKEKNILYLRGINQCNDSVVLGSPDNPGKVLTIKGSGVLIANGITINCGIKKDKDNAICVLYCRNGNMTINTDQEIQASLICMGQLYENMKFSTTKKLKLKGSLALDYLNLDDWCEGEHEITYDSALVPNHDVYNVTINKSTTFERVIENE